ncbi:TonB-dependent receptor [uncultured Abyssibacter sp.]|uniref:TonB-dependent receptor n=1 Tax=uncultured Abyssibacter sp. TaxID=2320202 RepID=UPI0032B28623
MTGNHWSWGILIVLASAVPLTGHAQDDDFFDELFAEEREDSTSEPASSRPADDGEASTAPQRDPDADQTPETVDVIQLPEEQKTFDDDAPPRTRSRLVEEIVVTAQKREESLQDVPISVQAFSGDKLDALGITEQTDLQRITPGLNVTEQVSYTITFLRGIGTDATIAADPSVATYIDGIYYPFASNLAQNFGAVERIEVLKGPQGTLFGRNATGGAISIHTKKPEFEGFFGEFMGEVGSFDRKLGRVHLNLPIGDTMAASITALRGESEGYYSGLHGTPRRPIPGNRQEGYRIKLRAQPTENLDINLAALHFEMYLGTDSVGFTSDPSALGATLGIQPQPGYEGEVDALLRNDTDANDVVYGSIEYTAPWFDVKLLGSDQRMDTYGVRDFDGSPRPLMVLATPSQYIDAQSAEIQILSNGEWGPDWLEWIVGGFFFQAENGFGELDFQVAGLDLATGTVLGIALPPALVNLLNTVVEPLPIGLPTGEFDLTGLIGTDSRAVFAQTTISFTEWLDLTLGGRYQVEERFIIESTANLDTSDGEIPLINNSNRAEDSDGNPYPTRDIQKDFTPKVSLQLRPFDNDTLIYLSWQEAIKAATYNTVVLYTAPNYVEPEELRATEIGIKTSFFNGLATFNAAAFDYDVKNLQTYYLSLFAGGVISFQNAGRAKIRGLEFDTLLQLFPSVIDNLVLAGGAAYLDTEYVDFDGASGFGENGAFRQNQNNTGNQVIRTPELTATASLSKTWDVPGGPLELAFDAYYTDDFYYEATNRDASLQESYWLFGSRISYLYAPWDLRATFSVDNLTDEFYTAGFFATDFGVQPTLAPPRSYRFQMIWNF